MNPIDQTQQNNLVREQFTRTAEVFGNFAVVTRVGDAELLASLVRADEAGRALDVACGPGTLALRFARHARRVCALDVTPTILGRARETARAEGLANLDFVLGDALALPFANGSLDVAVTSYSLHHMADPARAVAEMARVVRRGGRVGVIDIRVAEAPGSAEINNRIERLRDASHTRTLYRREFDEMFAAGGLRILEARIVEQIREFDHWLLVAGWKPGDERYAEVRSLMESTLSDDLAGFHPRMIRPAEGGDPKLHITNTVLFIAGEKL